VLVLVVAEGVGDIGEEYFVYCASYGSLRPQISHWNLVRCELLDNKLFTSHSTGNKMSQKGPL